MQPYALDAADSEESQEDWGARLTGGALDAAGYLRRARVPVQALFQMSRLLGQHAARRGRTARGTGSDPSVRALVLERTDDLVAWQAFMLDGLEAVEGGLPLAALSRHLKDVARTMVLLESLAGGGASGYAQAAPTATQHRPPLRA